MSEHTPHSLIISIQIPETTMYRHMPHKGAVMTSLPFNLNYLQLSYYCAELGNLNLVSNAGAVLRMILKRHSFHFTDYGRGLRAKTKCSLPPSQWTELKDYTQRNWEVLDFVVQLSSTSKQVPLPSKPALLGLLRSHCQYSFSFGCWFKKEAGRDWKDHSTDTPFKAAGSRLEPGSCAYQHSTLSKWVILPTLMGWLFIRTLISSGSW